MPGDEGPFDIMATWTQLVSLYAAAWTEAMGLSEANEHVRAASVLEAALVRMQEATERAEALAYGEFAAPLPPGTGPRLADLTARVERVIERIGAIEAAVRAMPPAHERPEADASEPAAEHLRATGKGDKKRGHHGKKGKK